jgi:hypothetical protein
MHPRSTPVWKAANYRTGQQLKPGGELYRKVLRVCEASGVTDRDELWEWNTFHRIARRSAESWSEVQEMKQLRATGIPDELLAELFQTGE